MKHLKLILVVAVMAMSSMAFANPETAFVDDKGSISFEIEKMLSNSNLIIEKELNVKVIFILSEDRRIQIYSIESENEKVNQFVHKRLQDKELAGTSLEVAKYYELPIKVKGE